MAQLESANGNIEDIKICCKLRDSERRVYEGKTLSILQRIKLLRDKEWKWCKFHVRRKYECAIRTQIIQAEHR